MNSEKSTKGVEEMWLPKGWGDYPVEYNREIHGPYNPSVYYGKRDTPFMDVKLGELLPWLARRRKSPRAMVQAFSRVMFKYYLTWINVRKPSIIFVYQIVAVTSVIGGITYYPVIKHYKKYRYH